MALMDTGYVANYLEYTRQAPLPRNWSERSTPTRILSAEIVDLETIDDPVADSLLSIVRAGNAATVVAVVSIENSQGRRSTLVVDTTWLLLAAESLLLHPELTDELMLPNHAVIAEIPIDHGLLAAPPDGVTRAPHRRQSR